MGQDEEYTFGELLRGFRKRAGISAQELADRLHVHRNMVSRWENGGGLQKKQRIKELALVLHLSEQEKNTLLAAAFEQAESEEHTQQFIPPSTHPKSILQRTAVVQHIFSQLTQAGTSAVVLTGIAGVGKSTLAALVYQFAEQQRDLQAGPFTAPALWLPGAPSMSMTDFTRILLVCLGKTRVEVSNLPPLRLLHLSRSCRDRQALALYRELEDRKGIANVLMMLGWVYTGLWDYVQAKEYGEQALAIFLELGDRQGQSWTFGKLSAIYDNSGQKEQAKASREQVLAMMREEKDKYGEGWTLKHLGQLYHDLGQSERAIDAFQHALAIFRSLDSPRGEAWSLNSLGKVYHDTDQREQALQTLEHSLAIFTHDVEDLWGKGAVLNKLGRWYQKMGDRQRSFFYYEQALRTRKGTGDLWGEAQTASHIGVFYAEQGQYQQALTFLERARTLFERVKSPDLQDVLQQIDMVRMQASSL